MSEADRIADVYRAYRETEAKQALWDEGNPGNQAILRERQSKTYKVLYSNGFLPLNGKKILEVGCGTGKTLAGLAELGAEPQNLFGVDLLPDRVEEAKARYSNLHFECGNAEKLNFPNASFDLILFFTVFSSILDGDMAKNVASEAQRVLKPGGAMLWYDFRFNNPGNPNVRGIRKRDIKTLFPKLRMRLSTITLLPPIARRLGKSAPTVYPILSTIPFLRTHYLGLLIQSET
jgi:ubiquinone/menaquinone biosynthesis C-methylase UbiE